MDSSFKVAEIPASRGAAWLVQAWGLFRLRPMQWIGLCAGWIIITFGLLIIPFLGGVLANFLQPVFFASFAITAFRQSEGEAVVLGDLFIGFRRNLRSLVNLGALMLIIEIAVFALMALLGLPMANESDQPFTIGEYMEALKGKEWILAAGFALTVVAKGSLWFAAPLMAFHEMSTTHAIRWSVYATLSNIGAMLVYGLLLFGFFLLALIPWALGLIVLIPVMAISTWFGYRDVFEAKIMGSDPISPDDGSGNGV